MKRTLNFIIRIINGVCSRLKTYISFFISFLICLTFKVKKRRVLFWSTEGKDYSCNPLSISDCLLAEHHNDFDIYWLFQKNANVTLVDKRIKKVYYGSLMHFYIFHTAEFLITNHRTSPKMFYWIKRKDQKYIMTWHGSMPLKKIEKDAENTLPKSYIKTAQIDSKLCDLMISDSQWYSNLIRSSFWYTGEILEKGMPRNDVFYKNEIHSKIRENVAESYGIEKDAEKLFVLYAPTFRTNHSTDNYILKWYKIKKTIEDHYKKDTVILLRLHPTLLDIINTEDLITEEYVKNASKYPNMQELLIASDMLITDYSSTMFECALLKKPCFLFTPDLEEYDRGMYFPFTDLPFTSARTCDELEHNITCLDVSAYLKKTDCFVNQFFHPFGNGNASHEVVKWMLEKTSNGK